MKEKIDFALYGKEVKLKANCLHFDLQVLKPVRSFQTDFYKH